MTKVIITKKSKTAKEFIPTIFQKVDGENIETVNALIIYGHLEVKKDFSSWIKNQIKRAGLLEGKDYIQITLEGELKNRGVTKKEYFLTVDSVKHIGMISATEKGREIRDYFIERDKKLARLENITNKRKADIACQHARIEGKKLRLEETDTIKIFVEYAKKQGSTKANMYYQCLTKMENAALFYIVDGMPKPNNLRDVLDTFQLFQISVADKMVSDTLIRCMEKNMHYKDIYQECADKVRQLVAAIGRTAIPVQQYALLN